jgi:dolichol-phosphate mannosyltransferase
METFQVDTFGSAQLVADVPELAVVVPTFNQLVAVVPELAVVVPTFNERDNVIPLLEKIEEVLPGVAWEVVFVDDDSRDGTSAVVTERSRIDPRVRILRRIGRRGLASAVVEGIQSTSTPYVAVIDADMQHDERVLKQMLESLRSGEADLAVGTRYAGDGGVGDWDSRRQTISWVATRLSALAVRANLSDPMSGFFMIRRDAFEASLRQLSQQGYKILLDIVASAPKPLRIKEFPYVFRNRQHGESKLDALVSLEYLMLLLDKMFGRFVPARFILFVAIGGLGVFVHMAVLTALLKAVGASFVVGQSAATLISMTFNFFLNNTLTYRDMRLKGFWPVLGGLLSFYLVCSLGAVSNVGIANFMFSHSYSWWVSGIAGIAVGAVWNYAASSVFTWRKR